MEKPVQLRLVNKTYGFEDYVCVIMQKNEISTHAPSAIAWQVVENLGEGDVYQFEYTDALKVEASDSYGNLSPKFDANYGEMFKMVKTEHGDELIHDGKALSPGEIDLLNGLPIGAVNFHCYRSGHRVAQKNGVPPEQRAHFKFLPIIYLGVVSYGEVEMGAEINPLLLPFIQFKMSLNGLSSADIVMTGGGGGITSKPFIFTVENVVQTTAE